VCTLPPRRLVRRPVADHLHSSHRTQVCLSTPAPRSNAAPLYAAPSSASSSACTSPQLRVVPHTACHDDPTGPALSLEPRPTPNTHHTCVYVYMQPYLTLVSPSTRAPIPAHTAVYLTSNATLACPPTRLRCQWLHAASSPTITCSYRCLSRLPTLHLTKLCTDRINNRICPKCYMHTIPCTRSHTTSSSRAQYT
jgi:hypothetical protein